MTGKLRHKITFKEPNTSTDGSGFISASSTDSYEAWADVRPLKGRRLLEFGQIASSNPVEIRTRYNDQLDGSGFSAKDITAKYEISFREKTFTIHSVINEGYRDKYLIIIAYVRD